MSAELVMRSDSVYFNDIALNYVPAIEDDDPMIDTLDVMLEFGLFQMDN